jgi:hypothetical protein
MRGETERGEKHFSSAREDPFLAGGRVMLFEKLIPFTLKYVDFDQNVVTIGSAELLRVKLAQLGPDENPSEVVVEVTTDSDLYFYYTHDCDPERLEQTVKEQHFCSELRDYAGALIKVLNKIEQEPRKFNATLTILSDMKASLSITMQSEFKLIIILAIEFSGECEENYLQASIYYRFFSVKDRADMLNDRLQLIVQTIRDKNPSLLHQVQKVVRK